MMARLLIEIGVGLWWTAQILFWGTLGLMLITSIVFWLEVVYP